MRRILVITTFICFVNTVYSQNEVLFKVITLSYGTNIDGNVIGVGDDVTAASKNIIIPKDGYLGVVTADGFAYELRNSIAVADVKAFVKGQQPVPTGAKLRTQRSYLNIYPANAAYGIVIYGDSLFMSWEEDLEKNRVAGIEYELKIGNRYDSELDSKTLEHNWIVIDLKPYFQLDDRVGILILSKKTRATGEASAKHETTFPQKLQTDLERLNDHHDLAMLCAVLELNKAVHDRNFVVYKFMTRGHKTSGVLGTYMGLLMRDIDMK